jgi:hypothetical protein
MSMARNKEKMEALIKLTSQNPSTFIPWSTTGQSKHFAVSESTFMREEKSEQVKKVCHSSGKVKN